MKPIVAAIALVLSPLAASSAEVYGGVGTTGAELGPSDANKLLLQGPSEKEGAEPKEFEPALNKNFTPLAMGGSGKVSAPLVFVGYGITAKDLKKDFVYDDYAGIDVKGKVVVIIRKEPQQRKH